MSKINIEHALKMAIVANDLHEWTLLHGIVNQRENHFTIPMCNYIPFCYSQVHLPNPFGGHEFIDLMKYNDGNRDNIDWALEAKHYSPHQDGTLLIYLHKCLGGPIKDLLKLTDCNFQRFYILQLQTHIKDFTLFPGVLYARLISIFPFFRYLSTVSEVAARSNINRIIDQDRIHELEEYSRQKLDRNLICSYITIPVSNNLAKVDVAVHYLISGPFNATDIRVRLTTGPPHLDPVLPLEHQIGRAGQPATWAIDVSIESDENE